jgi:small-conductance mechanosensitive channel
MSLIREAALARRGSFNRGSRAFRAAGNALLPLGLALVILGFGSVVFSQAPASPGPDASQVIQFLNQTIGWYRQFPALERIATDPADWMAIYNNRQTANQVVQLTFDFARARADAIAKEAGASQPQSTGASSTQYQALRQWQTKIDKQIKDTQAERDADLQKLASATGKRRQQLQAEVSELQGELALAQARRDALKGMVEFVSGAGSGGLGATGLRAQIEALAGSVPAALPSTTSAGRTAAPAPAAQTDLLAAAAANRPEASGIWGLTERVFALSDKIHTLDSAIAQTEAMAAASSQLRAPMVARLRSLSQQGDQLATQADTADPSTLEQERLQLDALAVQFKQVTAALIPLGKQNVLLGAYSRNIASWRDAVRADYRTTLESLLARLGFLLVVLAIVVAAAEVWRRGIYHYVRDPRRRYQFLLLRKFAMWFLIAGIVGLTFASRLGSVLTFAGLLTAGVALALQNVILSVVGYFFLIGKFGVKVGDRVQIGDVRGEIVDIGLVRLHLVELRGAGADIPTGRVVAYSNSIVFQPAGLFKQIPGTSFVWHEITLTLSPETDYGSAKKRLSEAVDAVLADYREEMGRQSRRLETFGAAPADALRPRSQLRFTPAGLDVIIRFPVDLRHAAEIDEQITRELLKALAREPEMKLAPAPAQGIRLRTGLPAPGSSA